MFLVKRGLSSSKERLERASVPGVSFEKRKIVPKERTMRGMINFYSSAPFNFPQPKVARQQRDVEAVILGDVHRLRY